MGEFTKMLKLIFNKKAFQKIAAYILLILLIFIFIDFLGLFLLTFLFAFFFLSTAKFLKSKLSVLSKQFLFLKFTKKIPLWLLIIIEYILFIWLIIYIFSNIIPTIKNEVNSITNEFSIINNIENKQNSYIVEPELNDKSGSVKIIVAINDFKETILQKLIIIDPEDNLKITKYIENFWQNIDITSLGEQFINFLSAFWSSILKIILALILSFIFILDRKHLSKYLFKIKDSNFGFLYTEYDLLLDKGVKSFWLILKAQWTIAFFNMIITISGFYIIGLFFGNFPYILTMALVVFVLWFIPILGMWLSAIPLTLIAYINWGIDASLLVIFMILFTTILEAYYLNPKIVSSYLKVPMSLTFIILLISEHFLGLAGLLIWISLFYFSVWLLKDFNENIWKNKEKIENWKLKNLFTKRKK